MNTKIIAMCGAGYLAAVALWGSAGVSMADTPTGSGADAIVQHLTDEGYTVQFNMPSTMTLSRCTVSGINGLTVMMSPDGNLMAMMAPAGSRGDVYVTLNCPDTNN